VKINNVAYSWPGGQGGANTFLRNDGSGSLTWAAGAAGTPGDDNGAVQFNNAGAFGGDDQNFYWDNANKYLGIGTGAPLAGVLHVKGSLDPLVLVDATGGGIGVVRWAVNGTGKWGWCLNDVVGAEFTLWHFEAPAQSYITVGANGKVLLAPTSGSVGIGTNNPGGGTGSPVLSIASTATAPTAVVGVSHIYTVAGEGWWMDGGGNTTLQTPHDPETGEWIFFSKNVKTGRVVRINVEQLVKEVERLSGKQFMTETFEQKEE
ncbi:MAG: hypothetical protein RDV41_04960, partial [Planctomycetota bacterium]|nr:hypothetical protein [Planctomycetota bacterium]